MKMKLINVLVFFLSAFMTTASLVTNERDLKAMKVVKVRCPIDYFRQEISCD
jgi:hypothetical protein